MHSRPLRADLVGQYGDDYYHRIHVFPGLIELGNLFDYGGLWKNAVTSASTAIVFQGVRYEPHPISDDGIRLTGESSADVLKITVAAELPTALLFRAAPPSGEIFVTLWDYHAGLSDLVDSAEIAWIGSVSLVRWPEVDRAEICCESLGARMARSSLRLTWERNCSYTIYDTLCKVDRRLHSAVYTIEALDGARITCRTDTPGIFAGGFVEWISKTGNTEERSISVEISGGAPFIVLTLLGGTHGLALGMKVTLYKGCNGTISGCQARFNNHFNFGGCPHAPGESPFDGTQLL